MGTLSELKQPIVLDLGYCSIRIGFCNLWDLKLKPDYVEETFFTQKLDTQLEFMGQNGQSNPLITEHCAHCRCIHRDYLESLTWNYLGIREIAEHPILLVESALTDRKCRTAKLEAFFEEVGAQRFALTNEALMSLYSCGRHTGVVAVSGYSEAYCCAIHEGILPSFAIVPMNHNSGHELVKMTRDILRGGCKAANGHHDITLQHAMSFMKTSGKVSHVTQDSPSDAGSEVGELLFGTSSKNPGLHAVVEQAIYQADEEEDYNHHYYKNIVLSGGSTKLPGLPERLRAELERTKVDSSAEVSVIATTYREHAPWVGGSIAASLPTFQNHWITRQDYEEFGGNILRRKCLR